TSRPCDRRPQSARKHYDEAHDKVPHNAVLTEKVFRWWDFPLFIALTGLSVSAILYFFSYWFSQKDWNQSPLIFSILTLMVFVILLNNQGRWFLLLCMRKPRPMAVPPGLRVGVATTFVPGSEPLEMLEQTVKALVAMDYPHDTWVLDEGDDEQVKALCRRLGANHFSRKSVPHHRTESGTFQSDSKHGNYNAWFDEIGFNQYDIITAFDPDHVPNPDFLSNMLGYFADPEVGYVQAAQHYYNYRASFIARGAAEESYAFYSSDQMASYGLGYPILIGCHNTHRVTALKEVGGFPAHDAEDLLLTVLYRAVGWKGVYAPQILASGLTSVDWSGYLGLQRRWARSVLDVKLRLYPKLSRNLSFRARTIGLLHGLNYLYRSLIIFSSIILVAFMLATANTPNVFTYSGVQSLTILLAILQLCEFYRQRFYLNPRNEWGFHWRVAVLQFAKWPYLLLAFFDVLMGRRVPYVLTPKVTTKSRHKLLFWPHLIVAVVIFAAWTLSMLSGQALHPLLHICAATIVTGSLALIFTEHLNFPDAYDNALFSSVRRGH
ncbi:MAG: glycosyltransferase, partial [Pyrinomonadaceae bacterium]